MTRGETFWHGWQVFMVLVSVTGQRLVGKQKSIGWVVCLGGSVLWTTYGVVDGQIGALLNGILFGGVYVLNLTEWTTNVKRSGAGKMWLFWLILILVTFTSDARILI
jgi:hypothetical protein